MNSEVWCIPHEASGRPLLLSIPPMIQMKKKAILVCGKC